MKTTRDKEMDRECFDYMDGLIKTQDDHYLNETIKSLYYELILEGFEGRDIEDFLYEKMRRKLGHLKNM